MTTITQSPKDSGSIWKRAYTPIKSFEESSQYTPAERAVHRLDKKVAELEDTIRGLKSKEH